MAYQANFKIVKTSDNTKLKIIDISVGNEIPIERTITIKKTDLTEEVYNFISGSNELLVGNFNKDYALHIEYDAVVSSNVEGSVYKRIKEIITTGYTSKIISKRFIDLKLNKNIQNKQNHIQITMELEYYLNNANERVRFGDLSGAQEFLDFCADLGAKNC